MAVWPVRVIGAPKNVLRILTWPGQRLKAQNPQDLVVEVVARLVFLAKKQVGTGRRLPISTDVQARILLRELNVEKKAR